MVPDNSRVSDDGHAAVVANGMFKFARQAKHTDSFAATRLSVTNGSGGDSASYNIDLAARHLGSDLASQFYVAKLVYKQLIFTDYPALAILDDTQYNPVAGTIDTAIEGVDYIKLTKPGTVATCPGSSQDKCTEFPPLTSAAGSAVLQIAVWKDIPESVTVITAAVGWACPSTSGTSVYDCGHVCCFQKTDGSASRLDVTGQFWIFGHHTDVKHRLEWFRVGDASSGPWP